MSQLSTYAFVPSSRPCSRQLCLLPSSTPPPLTLLAEPSLLPRRRSSSWPTGKPSSRSKPPLLPKTPRRRHPQQPRFRDDERDGPAHGHGQGRTHHGGSGAVDTEWTAAGSYARAVVGVQIKDTTRVFWGTQARCEHAAYSRQKGHGWQRHSREGDGGGGVGKRGRLGAACVTRRAGGLPPRPVEGGEMGMARRYYQVEVGAGWWRAVRSGTRHSMSPLRQ